METTITEAQLAANVADYVDRVRQGEQFVIMRDGEEVAVLTAARPSLSSAVQGVAERLKNIAIPGDEEPDPSTAPA